MLIDPISIQIELSEGVAYVQYRESHDDETLSNEHIPDSENLLIERNSNGDIMGMDFLAVDDATLRAASWFALSNGLWFREHQATFLRQTFLETRPGCNIMWNDQQLTEPVSISIELVDALAYVAYRELTTDEIVYTTQAEHCSDIMVDRNRDRYITGIEFLDLDDETIDAAIWYAAPNGLLLSQRLGDFLRTTAREATSRR